MGIVWDSLEESLLWGQCCILRGVLGSVVKVDGGGGAGGYFEKHLKLFCLS